MDTKTLIILGAAAAAVYFFLLRKRDDRSTGPVAGGDYTPASDTVAGIIGASGKAASGILDSIAGLLSSD